MKADFYGRKSNKDQGRSVAGQEQEFRSDCAEQNLDVGKIFADPDRSASRYARKPRPDYEELVQHVRSGKCQVLSLWEASRGSRRIGEWSDFLDLCREKGVLIRIVSHNRTYDPRIRRDWRTLIEEGVDAADEAEKIGERTRRGKRLAAQEGRPASRLAYGFKRVYDERGKFVAQVEHPEQAAVVREIFNRVAAGEPYSTIADDLNDRALTAPEGGPWSDRQVRQVVTKPSYAGQRVHKDEQYEGQWDALVDPKVWRAANRRATAQSGLNNDPRLSHWLTGVVQCGPCAAALPPNTEKKITLRSATRADGRKAYECRNCMKVSASAAGLEGVIAPLLKARLSDPRYANVFAPPDNREALEAAEAERDRLKDHLAGFYEQAADPDSGLTAAGLAAVEKRMLPQIADAEALVRRLSTPPALHILADVDIPAEFDNLPIPLRREVVSHVADIVLMPGSKAGGPKFDPWRLAKSRWIGDDKTWGDYWRGETSAP